MNNQETNLEAQLRSLAKTAYPFHMPGHKRRLSPAPDLPIAWDFTEVEGADDLHHAEGILLEAMRRTALCFHAGRTWYLVGGSTVGNLAAVRACSHRNGEIIAARNCHKSVYHAIELSNLSVHWLLPRWDADWGIFGSIRPEDVEAALLAHPQSSCVVLTSPTYEGVVSDIGAIARICHAHGVPLVVDEAHGAHFGLFPEGGFPEGSITLGADLVVQSAHKTLPSLTQTALLHANLGLVSAEEVERQLDVFETSSPSYPLMASLDGCTRLLQTKGPALFSDWGKRLSHFDERAAGLTHLEVLCYGRDVRQNHPAFFDFDRSKLLLRAADPAVTGGALARILRERYHLESEMHLGRNVLLMTSCADTDEGFALLENALSDLDGRMPGDSAGKAPALQEAPALAGAAELPIGEALDAPAEEISEDAAAGRICAEYVFPYPPGIPVLVPGERIRREDLERLASYAGSGSTLLRSRGSGAGRIRVLTSQIN
ncbi:MAG: aminotransferase class I/II-fold pyridoxal phosphate-dependent enzyme [Lachnospiraceae bacterium]